MTPMAMMAMTNSIWSVAFEKDLPKPLTTKSANIRIDCDATNAMHLNTGTPPEECVRSMALVLNAL